MDEFLSQITTTARGMWNYRRWAMLIAWVVSAVGVSVVISMPDRYQASARVFLDTQSILRPLMSGIALQQNIEQQVAMLSRTLINRPTVERLVREVDLDLGVNSKADKDALVDSVTKAISIGSTGRDNLYTLSYQDQKPEVAQRVVQALLTIFVESSLGVSRKDSDSARRFLDEQIKSYEAKLSEAEGRLKDFKLRNIQMQSKAGLDSIERASEIGSMLSQARLELREAESARAAASRQLEALRMQSRETPPPTPEIDARLDVQKRSLDALLQRYTDAHPDVSNTRRMISELEAQKSKEIEELRRKAKLSPATQGAEASPALQELSRLYSAAEVQAASLRARVAEYETRASHAQDQLKVAPQLEAELAQLNRDYQVHQKNYGDLVSRRETALMTGELESTSSGGDFRIIDPPRVNPKPVAPNKVLLLPASLLAALASGLGLAFLMSQVRPVFFDGAALRQVTDLPLLGVVELVSTEGLRQHELRSLKRFLAALFTLIVLYAVGMVLLSYQSGMLG